METVKQIFQNLNSGETEIVDLPCPAVKDNNVLIETELTLISAGTERMLVDFGKSSLLQKARSQPEKVKQVLDKVKTDGVLETFDAVKSKLDQPLSLGYSNVGRVIEVGSKVSEFKVGDRVLSNGSHASHVCVSKNLCAKIPGNVNSDEAVFSVLGAIALQGIRLSNPSLGETYAVFGMGLIGLLTVQMLQANGVKVLAVDFSKERLKIASSYGADTVDLSANEDPVDAANKITDNIGVDAVLLTAATKSSEPVHQAAVMCRKRGRIVLVGVTGLELRRADFFEKELTFQVSCSYGPGRYDPEYEDKGHDYPIGYVRWTEKRNFEAVLNLFSQGKILTKNLISHRFDLLKAAQAYDMISSGSQPYLGVVLDNTFFSSKKGSKPALSVAFADYGKKAKDKPGIAFIGAGNFAGRILIPAFERNAANLQVIASSQGISSTHLGKKFNFKESTTDLDRVFSNDKVDVVVITTRHDSHKKLVLKSLKAGKHVFVEKPLCLNESELQEIKELLFSIHADKRPQLFVGFNRRFSPFTAKIKDLLASEQRAKFMIMTVNAGFISKDSWIQDRKIGGGRIIGECCHFIDLLTNIAGEEISAISINNLKDGKYDDSLSINLSFSKGSIGTIHYFSNGPKSFQKERVEIFTGGKSISLDNFRMLKTDGFKQLKKFKTLKQNKGHLDEVALFLESLKTGSSLIPFEEIEMVMNSSFEAQGLFSNGN